MTEVVTHTAAYLQSLLFAPRQQAFGVSNPDSSQSTLELALAASQQQAATDATQVAQVGDNRSSLTQGDDNAPSRNFADQLPTSQYKAPEPSLAAPTGPAKARVDIPVFEITANAPASQTETAPAPTPEPKPLSFGSLGGGPAGPLQQPVEAPAAPASTGILGPAAVVHDSELSTANVFGAAFAPTQVVQASTDPAPALTQKNFIFAQRKLFNEQAVVEQAGKFASEDAKTKTFAANATVGKFAPQPTAVAAATVGAQFAANAESAQRLFDKVAVTSNGADSLTSDTRLYDKVTQADTDNQNNSGNNGPGDQSLDSRQSLYQRAQAVAQALGEKSGNPAVRKLVATLEAYAVVAKIGGSRGARPTVRVLA